MAAPPTAAVFAEGWTTTGNLATGRYSHTATLLGNGKVLVVGGADVNNQSLNSAELFSDGLWVNTGNLIKARADHSATLLNDGRVLVVGGDNTLTSAEIYNPLTSAWTTTGNLTNGRYRHAAVLLNTGKVLVVGGFNAPSSAELFDPASGTWSSAGTLPTPRTSLTATVLPNGLVLVVGGSTSNAELYNPFTNTWTSTGSTNWIHSQHTATLLTNNQVLLAGGVTFPDAEIYNPTTGTWREATTPATARKRHTATKLPNNKLLVIGGRDNNGVISNSELYDPNTEIWSSPVQSPIARELHTATSMSDEKVLVTGGISSGGAVIGTTQIYEPGQVNCLSFTTQPQNTSGYVDGSVSFAAQAAGATPLTVKWQVSKDNGVGFEDLLNQTSLTLTLPALALVQNGYLYRAVLTNSCGSITSATAKLTVQLVPTVITIAAPSNPAPPGSINFTITVNTQAPNLGIPQGLIRLTIDGYALGATHANLASGVNSVVMQTNLAAGAHSIWAQYTSTGRWENSQATITQIIAVPTTSGEQVMVTSYVGTSADTSPVHSISTTFSNVSTAGVTTVTPLEPAALPATPPNFKLTEISQAYDIQTTATFQGTITLAFNVPSVNDPVVFNKLSVLHGEGTPKVFVDRTSNRNFSTRMIYASVTSLSPFVIAEATSGGNIAPTITPQTTLSRVSGVPVTNSKIATVSDTEDVISTLMVKVNDGNSATVNGITISNVTVNPAGDIMADIEANCSATTAHFTLKVIDSANASAIATLPVTTTALAPTLSINDFTIDEGNSGQTNASFTVTLTGAQNSCVPITVNYSTAPQSGGDFVATSGTLTFPTPITSDSVTQTINVPVNGDVTVEGDETFSLNLIAVSA